MADLSSALGAVPALLYGVIDRLTTVKGRVYLLGTRLSGGELPAAEIQDYLAAVDRDLDAAVAQLRQMEEAAAAELLGLQEAAAADVTLMQEEAAADVVVRQGETASALKRQQATTASEVRGLHERTAAEARRLRGRSDPSSH